MRSLMIVLLVAGCRSSGASNHAAPAPTETSDFDLCMQLRVALRACSDDYIPALVDTRIKLDYPAGIAAAGSTPEGRAAAIATAKDEWKTDSSDDHNRSLCQMIIDSTSPDIRAQSRPKTMECVAMPECKARIACYQPMLDQIMAGRKASGH